jgi:adenosylcobinamide-GDP ribazoletransferase
VPDVRHAGRALLVAAGFLTRLPMQRPPSLPASEFAAAAVLFPLVGAALGGVIGGIALALAQVLPAFLAATLAVGLELALTGALHIDGLADSADGLAGRDPEHSLEIMRDHSLGAYGASALALDLLAKATALGALTGGAGMVLPVVAVFAVSRAAALPLAAGLPYARTGDGTGRALADRLCIRGAAGGVALAAVIAVAATGIWALGTLACLALAIGTVGWLAQRRLGGVTGDVMGAVIELTATLGLIFAAGWKA